MGYTELSLEVSNMNPRLKNSKKWTAFPKDYVSQIEDVFKQNFKSQLGSSQLIIEGRIYTEEILLRVGVLEKGRLSQANFEVSMNYSAKDKDAIERIHDCIDAAASMMAEYYDSKGEVDFPRTWNEYEFNGRKLYLQFSTENSSLEAEADKLLGKSFEEMVQEDKETEDAMARASERAEANLDDDESNDPASPTMFGGKKKKKSDLH